MEAIQNRFPIASDPYFIQDRAPSITKKRRFKSKSNTPAAVCPNTTDSATVKTDICSVRRNAKPNMSETAIPVQAAIAGYFTFAQE